MTLKQAQVVKSVFEDKMPIYKARELAGYSDPLNTPETTKSKAWREIVEAKLPVNEAIAVHRDAYSATKWNDFTGEREKDHNTRLKAADMTYKAHGMYQSTEKQGIGNMQVNIIGSSPGYMPPKRFNNTPNIIQSTNPKSSKR